MVVGVSTKYGVQQTQICFTTTLEDRILKMEFQFISDLTVFNAQLEADLYRKQLIRVIFKAKKNNRN